MVRTLKPNNIPYAKAKLIIDNNSPYTGFIVANQEVGIYKRKQESKKTRKKEIKTRTRPRK